MFQVAAALILLILKLTEPQNIWKSEYLGRYTVDLFTHLNVCLILRRVVEAVLFTFEIYS